jgi:hypothetical protein
MHMGRILNPYGIDAADDVETAHVDITGIGHQQGGEVVAGLHFGGDAHGIDREHATSPVPVSRRGDRISRGTAVAGISREKGALHARSNVGSPAVYPGGRPVGHERAAIEDGTLARAIGPVDYRLFGGAGARDAKLPPPGFAALEEDPVPRGKGKAGHLAKAAPGAFGTLPVVGVQAAGGIHVIVRGACNGTDRHA